MTRTYYINRQLRAIVGDSKPFATLRRWVEGMADRAATVYQFDQESQEGDQQR